ncbi:MAG: hypothetical protein HY822_22845 [Acidobacteria bacterium]|nr:hypothetical protein [Acidobacteriota bacterium]
MHYTDDELLERLYGIGRQDGHLEQCEPCRTRWERLLRRRRTILEPPAVSEAWLAGQRARVLERAARPPLGLFRPVAALAAVTLLALLIGGPRERALPVVAAADAQLFSEVYTLIQNDAPRAAAPVRALFEEPR